MTDPAGADGARTAPALVRRLGTGDAVAIGFGSMIGAGVFAAFAPTAAAAGAGLLVGLGVAAVVAYANATASAQLAAQYPTSGGTYVYGRERLGPWWGFAAGWGFLIGKTASCAAMALTFAAYAAPRGWERPTAVVAVVLLAAVNYRGITRTARLTRVLVALVLVALAATVGASLTQSGRHRRFPRALQAVGTLGCLVLVLTLPPPAVLTGSGVLVAGLAVRLWRTRPGVPAGR